MSDMQWPKLLSVNSGRNLNKDESAMWYVELCHALDWFRDRDDSANDDELCMAIRWAFSDKNPNPPSKGKWDLSKNDLQRWVETARASGATSKVNSERREQCRKLLDDIKARIREETDPCRLWDLICEPRIEDGFKEKVYSYLECYVIEVHPDWERPGEYIASKWREVRDAMNQMIDNIHDKPYEDNDPRFDTSRSQRG